MTISINCLQKHQNHKNNVMCTLVFTFKVDDQREEEATGGVPSKEVVKRTKEEDMNMNIYKGYEVLLDLEEDPNYSAPKGKMIKDFT